MPKSSTRRRLSPEAMKLLPYEDFPLSPHLPTRRWYKVIRGTRFYFGPLDRPDEALAKYETEREARYAGRQPRPTGDGLTVALLCNHFMSAKSRKLDAGEMKPKTWGDYYAVCEMLTAAFGKDRPVDDLTAEDFGELRASFAKGRGVHGVANLVRRTRSVFKYAYEAGLINRPVRYGPEFVQPGPREMRKARAAGGKRTFEAEEVRAMLDAASVPMRAMILLGINCAYGPTDCSELRQDAIDFDAGIIHYPRPKTGIERRCALWSETVKALQDAIDARPKARTKDDADLVFLTRYGKRWVRHAPNKNSEAGVSVNSVALEFGKVADEAGIERNGRGFYALRHSLRSVAESEGVANGFYDEWAINLVMGHDNHKIADNYRHMSMDERLRTVAGHVHGWLYGKPKRKTTKKKASKKKAKR